MIFVTGGTGLLGTHLLYYLCKAGKDVRATKRSTSDVSRVLQTFAYYTDDHLALFNRIEWVEADMADIFSLDEALKGVSQVYHCAGMVSFRATDRKHLFAVNTEGTANLVDACLKAGVEKFCYVSSIAALGRNTQSGVINEQTHYEPSQRNSWYSRSKYSGECEVWKGVALGLKAIIVNPSIILGPGDWEKSSSTLIPLAWKGLKFYTRGVNGYVDVRDVAEACILLMESDSENDNFLLSSEDISYEELFTMICHKLNIPAPRWYAGKLLSAMAWMGSGVISFLTGSPSVITRSTARTAHQKYYYSSKKIRESHGFIFRTIGETIQHTTEIFLREHQC